ncbi:Hypothetical_protein [Hexamita inflata]|uniref:Hypothetical_protein n=1 Tax=Hexamita inflata TaxID=28002 RepID=A0AA86QSB5_9EUKA|nr:Hypothetical protein HINF_LOCUS52791 [Hexamita inflata]
MVCTVTTYISTYNDGKVKLPVIKHFCQNERTHLQEFKDVQTIQFISNPQVCLTIRVQNNSECQFVTQQVKSNSSRHTILFQKQQQLYCTTECQQPLIIIDYSRI